jgi:hypothetical protein
MMSTTSSLPEWLSPKDRELWFALSPSARSKASARAEALETWLRVATADEPRRVGEAVGLARAAGVSRTHFYQLAAAWRKGRSLASLGVRAKEPEPELASNTVGRRAVIEEAMVELVAGDTGVGTEEILRRLAGSGVADGVSRATLLRWLSDVRRRAGRIEALGERLALDMGWLRMADAEGSRFGVCVLIDLGTGLALGWSTTSGEAMSQGYLACLDDAMLNLEQWNLGGVEIASDAPSVQVWVWRRLRDADTPRVMERLSGTHAVERDADVPRIVRPIRRHLGGRAGRLSIDQYQRPEHVVVTAELGDAADVVDAAMLERNSRIFGRILRGNETPEARRARLELRRCLGGRRTRFADPAGQ